MPETERKSETSPLGVPTATPDATAPSARLTPPTHELTVLATVAHELRGPLTALATSSELLAEDFLHLDPAQVKHMLDAMHRRTVWLQGLVENLLFAATIREGRLQLRRAPLLMADLVADVDVVVSPLLAQRGQQLKMRLASRLPTVDGDTRRLSQVLVNLILNASKFSPPDSIIDVSATARGSVVRVVVSDRGPGVPADQATRLFEPYYRSPSTAGSGKDGVGLGLSIVKSIVEAHGGEVGVENRRGGGASFWFTIPTAARPPHGKPHLSIVS